MVKFGNNVELSEYIIYSRDEQINGFYRSVLELHFPEEATYEVLKSIYDSEEAKNSILHTYVSSSDSENSVNCTSLYTSFTLNRGLTLKEVDGVNRWVLILAQKSDLERRLEEQSQQILDTNLAIAELASMIPSTET